ncbi:hypothetical protein CLU79DRAFT_847064 [Phycomyces nitens]|nr:hypothetical protein CLU79DRAFT_847064 [Phycomyces nitens]
MESSSIKYSKVIAYAMNQLKDAGKSISIHDVVYILRNEIIQSYTPSDINSFKRIWLSRITETARLKGFTLEIAKTFSSLDRSNMWTLSTGTVVELKMEEFSKTCNFDHPSHSLILDPDDTLTWDGTFTRQELDEIRSFKAPAFEIVPKTIISMPKHQSLDQMHKNVSEQYINPRSDSYNYWVKKSLIEGLDILMSNKASTIGDSEAEIVDRIWKIIPWAFDQGEIVAKREITSEVSTSQMNERRKLSSIDKISRQKTGKRVDMIFKYDSFEIGVYEAKKSSKDYSDGGISDERIKVPKIMKGMLTKLLTVAPSQQRQLKTIGLITSGLNIKLLAMDSPNGYVCRIQKTEAATYPSNKGLFIKLIQRCLRTIWCSRLTMERTITMMTEADDEEVSSSSLMLPPCFFFASENKSQKKTKRKIEEEE